MRTVIEKSPEHIAIIDVFSALSKDRIAFIDGDIDQELASEVIAQLLYFDSMSTTEPISIYINSYGGEISQGLAIYDIIKRLQAPVKTVCIGAASSMAAVLMLAGTERVGLKHSRIMFHELSGFNHGRFTELKSYYRETQIIQQQIVDIIEEVTTLSNVAEFIEEDRWFSSEEALECKILTKIA